MISLSAFPQSSKHVTDSLLRRIATSQEDSNRVNLYNSLVRIYYQKQSDSFFIYGHQALELSRKIKWRKGIANATNNLGLLVSDTGNHELALKYLEESLLINREINATLNIINNLTNIGRIYYRQGDFPVASTYFFDALKLAEQIGDHEKIAMVSTNLTATFCKQKDFERGEKYARLNLQHSELANAPFHSFKAFIALGEIRAEQGDTTASKTYYEKALQVAEVNAFRLSSAEALTNLCKLEDNYDSALVLGLRARSIYAEMSPHSSNATANLGDVASVYLNLYKSSSGPVRHVYLTKAEYYLREKVKQSREFKYVDLLATGLKDLSLICEWKNDYRSAYQYSEEYHLITDSLYSQETKNRIASLEGQREVALRDKEIQLNKQLLQSQRQRQLALIASVGLLVVIGLILYRQNHIRRLSNLKLLETNHKLDEANKTKARFFAILSHDLRGPIARLISFLHLQNESPEVFQPGQLEIHQQRIADSAENLLNNMEDLLLWSKAQMDQFKPVITQVPVGELFNHVAYSFNSRANPSMSFSDSNDLKLITDENFVRTIMLNLTNNAVRALEGKPDASIAWSASKTRNRTILSITDNGPGMPREVADSMFHSHLITSAKNGFGSQIVKDLAQAIRCEIDVKSQVGKGTTISLTFNDTDGPMSAA